MSKRVLVVVQRGVTDSTPITCFEHEVAILDTIHGEGAVRRLSLRDLAPKSLKATVIKGSTQAVILKDMPIDHPIKLAIAKKEIEIEEVSTAELLGRQLHLGEEFKGEPQEEYRRMVDVYGMHHEYKIANVEYVYGQFREGRFTKSLGVKSIEEMSIAELREKLDREGILYEKSNTRNELIALLTPQDEPQTEGT